MHCKHWVSCHWRAQPGHMPRVQKVFHTVPQSGVQTQRSTALGRQPHLGQKISASFIACCLHAPLYRPSRRMRAMAGNAHADMKVEDYDYASCHARGRWSCPTP